MQQHMQHIIITEDNSVKKLEDRTPIAIGRKSEVITFLRFENLSDLLF